MEESRLKLEKFAVDHDFPYIPQRGTVEFEEWAILQKMFEHAQNIALNYFKNYNNPQFWDKTFPKDFPFEDREPAKPTTASFVLHFCFFGLLIGIDNKWYKQNKQKQKTKQKKQCYIHFEAKCVVQCMKIRWYLMKMNCVHC